VATCPALDERLVATFVDAKVSRTGPPNDHNDPSKARGEEENYMIPLLTPERADLFFQTIMLLTAAFTVVCSSLMTWFRA